MSIHGTVGTGTVLVIARVVKMHSTVKVLHGTFTVLSERPVFAFVVVWYGTVPTVP
jgi:hypothetical protein